jgi:hypothetical protein
MPTTVKKMRDRLDSFEEAFVELVPIADEASDIAGQAAESPAQARENLAAVRRAIEAMSQWAGRAEAALT